MSWGCFNVMKCKKCGYEYIVENDTLSINMSTFGNCPICKSEGEELFKHRKKRERVIEIIGCDLCNYNCEKCLETK